MATKTIKSTGGDYANTVAWLASLPATLTEPEIAVVDAFDLQEVLYLTGKATTAANYIEIRAASGQRHNGVAGAGARIKSPTGVAAPIRIDVPHVRIIGMNLIQEPGSSQPALQFLTNANVAGSEIIIDGCLIYDETVSTTAYTILANGFANLNLTMKNTIVCGSRRTIDTRANAAQFFYNNIYWRRNASLGPIHDAAATVRNCYSGAAVAGQECFYTGSASPTGSHNISSDATATIDYPTGSQINIAGSAVFTSVTSGSENFTPLNGTTALHDTGTTIGSVTTDAAGVARPQGAAYDVGAFEFEESAGATATTLSGPSSGTTGVPSSDFTVGANGTITGTVTVTPNDGGDGGTFAPTSVAISSGTPTATFTYTPASTGVKVISTTNDGGLSNPTSINYTSNAAASTHDPVLSQRMRMSGYNYYGARR